MSKNEFVGKRFFHEEYSTPSWKVPVPDGYKKYLPPDNREDMHHADLQFFNKLLNKYGIAKGQEGNDQPFGKDEFFAAVSDMMDYAVGLRNQLEPSYNELPDDGVLNIFLLSIERMRESSQRLIPLCHLFLHYPKVKKVYLQVHAEKMATALPGFTERLATLDMEEVESREEYFKKVDAEMQESMVDSVDDTPRMQKLAVLMGYQQSIPMLKESARKRFFASVGVGTFTDFLRHAVEAGIQQGEDIHARVRDEFFDPKGTAQRLMRLSLYEFKSFEDLIDTEGIDGAKQELDEEAYTSGACPAILKLPASDENNESRPIAYEYAATIVKNMPPNLLQ